MSCYALIDCNNFYASCERVFNPELTHRPLVILSNNDGCVIARSEEAKAVGVAMGAPLFKIKALCRKFNIVVLSSNYALYGDMSGRVMSLIQSFESDMEMYSIDEAFLRLKSPDMNGLKRLRQHILKCTGLPVSIGLGPTKTLAKAANFMAKRIYQTSVYYLKAQDDLSLIQLKDIWGIGRRLSQHLLGMGIFNAEQLKQSELTSMRQRFGVVMERLIRELRGQNCLGLEEVEDKKQILCSRSFGCQITEKKHLQEAISHHVSRACEKLRAQKSDAAGIGVFLKPHRQHDVNLLNGSMAFPVSLSHTSHALKFAKLILERIYISHFIYSKAGVWLYGLSSREHRQFDMLTPIQQANEDSMMDLVDNINRRFGKHTLRLASSGFEQPWQMRQNHRSPKYTTSWQELPVVKC